MVASTNRTWVKHRSTNKLSPTAGGLSHDKRKDAATTPGKQHIHEWRVLKTTGYTGRDSNDTASSNK
ncbi:MAG: hypothetical protein NVS2B12_25240 [Ktedonobacteraceae bacterium]